MDELIETQMLNALEVFHYESKFRNKLFSIVIEEQINIKDIITDLRVIHASDIGLIIFCHNNPSLKSELELWTERGTKFKLLYDDVNSPLSSRKINEIKRLITQNIIPVIAFDKKLKHQLFADRSTIDTKVLDISEAINSCKVFFLSDFRGLVINGRFHSNPNSLQIKEFLSNPETINIGAERLQFIQTQNIDRGIEIILLEGKSGSLFKEIFTHRGAGTLFTQDYPNDVRKGELKDVTDISLLMKPYVSSGEILPISEDEIAQSIDNFFVFTINGAIVACSKIVDYGEFAELGKFCTLPRFQGKGRARKLAQRLLEEAKTLNKKYVFALSIEPKMWQFFESLGFYEIPRESLPESWKQNYNFNRPSKALKFDLL